MSSHKKTLIVFDTNKLRQVLKGSPSYGSFDFGIDFNKIKEFVKNKGLEEFIDIAIPDISIQELIQQKMEQYFRDCKDFQNIISRLSQLPATDFSALKMPDRDFKCDSYLHPFIEKLFNDNDIKVIKLPEESYAEIFEEIIKRALKRQPPFKGSNRSSDIGFKDVVLWETLLNYEEVENYSKVILLTEDKGFSENKCKEEFKVKKGRAFLIYQSTELALTELEESYGDIIEKSKFIEFANKDYFKDYINDVMTNLPSINIENKEYNIQNVNLIDILESVDYPRDEEAGIKVIFVSLVEGTALVNNQKKKIKIKIKTYLDDANGIIESELEYVQN